MSNIKIELGDVVTLKSDTAVLMTVGNYVQGDEHAFQCFYFLNGEIRTLIIRPEALIKIPVPES